MERRIYYNLAIVATITQIISSIFLILLFYNLYNFRMGPNPMDLSSMFLSALPVLIGLLVFILILLYLVSHLLTSKIIEPINIATQNIESILSGKELEDVYVYDELEPFIRTIKTQKREIEDYISKLKKAEKARRDITANVTHELKTPLTSIIGFAEVLKSGEVSKEDTIKFAEIIHKEGTRLLGLIDSILNLAHIEDKNGKKAFEMVNVSQIGREIVAQLSIRAKERDLDLNIKADDVSIYGNRRMIQDLIYNLVDNGLKYNKPKGRVDLLIGRSDNYCIIKVKDTGIGIPEEEQDKVFERFYRVDKSRSKKVGGSGLGLSIVKHIVNYHNGNISLKSELGKGTEIKVRLPIKTQSP